jgi:hypothetical protein
VVVGSLLIAGALAGAAAGQVPSGTEIFLAELDTTATELRVKTPVNITNRPGYDNQPSFTHDETLLLFTSIRHRQADIYQYDLHRKKVVRVTRTEESEYSPTPMPRTTEFSVVQVEADSTQRLWAFSADGKGARLLLPGVEPVGYHAWGDEHTVALFVLGEPHVLELVNLRTGSASRVAEDIGRSLHRIPGRRALSFTERAGRGWRIMELDLASHRTRPLVSGKGEGEDHAWTPDGIILMAEEQTVFAWGPEATSGWREVFRLDEPTMGRITRMAVSPSRRWLALVVDEGRADD